MFGKQKCFSALDCSIELKPLDPGLYAQGLHRVVEIGDGEVAMMWVESPWLKANFTSSHSCEDLHARKHKSQPAVTHCWRHPGYRKRLAGWVPAVPCDSSADDSTSKAVRDTGVAQDKGGGQGISLRSRQASSSSTAPMLAPVQGRRHQRGRRNGEPPWDRP